MATITIIDPVTRLEGHLKIQVTVDTVNGNSRSWTPRPPAPCSAALKIFS